MFFEAKALYLVEILSSFKGNNIVCTNSIYRLVCRIFSLENMNNAIISIDLIDILLLFVIEIAPISLRHCAYRVKGKSSFSGIYINGVLLGPEIPLHRCRCICREFDCYNSIFLWLHSLYFFCVMSCLSCSSIACCRAKHSVKRYCRVRGSSRQYCKRYQI